MGFLNGRSPAGGDDQQSTAGRERDFWGHQQPTYDEALAEVACGPDPNTAVMLDAVSLPAGSRILDFACGVGVTSVWLAQRGAQVVGVDITPESIEVARAVASHVGCDVEFRVAAVEELDDVSAFDAALGRYALHHVDVASVAPAFARVLKPGAPSAFLETMAANPFLRFARSTLTGRLGIPRYGTEDEHPLTRDDLLVLQRWLGELRTVTAEPTFLRILDRQVFHRRWPAVSSVLGRADDTLFSRSAAKRWSYHQVLVFGGSTA